MEDATGRLRELPSVDEVLSRPAVRALAEQVGRAAVKAAARQAIAAARERILSGGGNGELVADADVVQRAARAAAPRLRRVINATGVVLHTNLGRAPLHPEAVARVAEVASGYSNLELDLETGRRGHRRAAVEPRLCELAALAKKRGIPLLHDLGSGALELPEGLSESTAARSLADGADLVAVSGDKLLGGPQAGLLLGRRELVEACRRHPLARALRADRMLLAALEATLH